MMNAKRSFLKVLMLSFLALTPSLAQESPKPSQTPLNPPEALLTLTESQFQEIVHKAVAEAVRDAVAEERSKRLRTEQEAVTYGVYTAIVVFFVGAAVDHYLVHK